MENTKNTFIVVVKMESVDAEEFMRIKGVIRALTNKEPVAISDTKNTVMYFVHAVFEDLRKELDLVRAPGTNLFIARLSEPCTTIGFSSLKAALQAYGLGQGKSQK
jgi:hypothetical protein